MLNEVMEILPGFGIGPIRFGMTRHQVHHAIREGEVYEDWMGGNLNGTLLFHGLVLWFEFDGHGHVKVDGRLNEIWINKREGAELFGLPMSVWPRDDLFAELESRGLNPLYRNPEEIEVMAPYMCLGFDESLQLESLWINPFD